MIYGDCDEVPLKLEEVFQSLLEIVSLTSDQQDILFSLLIDYADVFAVSDDQLGQTNVLLHEIKMYLQFVSNFEECHLSNEKKCGDYYRICWQGISYLLLKVHGLHL